MHRPSDRQRNAKVLYGFVANWSLSQRTVLGDGNETSRVRLLRFYQIANRFRYKHSKVKFKKVFCSCQEQLVHIQITQIPSI